MTLQDIQADYIERNQELQKVKDKIDMRQKQIYRLEKKKDRAFESSHWINMVHDIMNVVAEKTPHINWNLSRSVTTGMRAQYYLFGKTIENDITVGICFTPDEDSHVRFDTGETIPGFNSNSIGAMNGFHKKSKRLEDIHELIDLVNTKEQEEIKRKAEEV